MLKNGQGVQPDNLSEARLAVQPICLYVSVDGSDTAAGTLEHPLGSVQGALRRLQDMAFAAQRPSLSLVYLRGGEYLLTEPIRLDTSHSMPMVFLPYEQEKPVFSGGVRITGFEESTLAGKRLWKAQVRHPARRDFYFRSLFVNGQRRNRTRLPATGFFTMEDVPDVDPGISVWQQLHNGTNRFVYRQGDFTPVKNLTDVDVVVHHLWVDERMPIESVDAESRTIVSSTRSAFVLKDESDQSFAHYYFENVFEALEEPGQWYLDRASQTLYYLPLEEEQLGQTEVIAPCICQFLTIDGDPGQGQYVENISFQGITFAYADWYHTMPLPERPPKRPQHPPAQPSLPYAAAGQAALHIPGAVALRGVRNATFADCSILQTGFYGIQLDEGCSQVRVTNCTIMDTGAGGIRAGGSSDPGQPGLLTGHNRFDNNHIHRGGQVFKDGIGILMTHSFRNIVSHNEIHDYLYTAISCGWVWGFMDSVSRENLIEHNDIYDIGKRVLSDMGGIYILGVQAGTIIRGNHIREVYSRNYGGWGIYLDEGSSFVVVENNLVHHVGNQCFNQHYGRENIIRNNIFAYSDDCVLSVTREQLRQGEPWPVSAHTRNSVSFLRNIVLSKDKPFHLFTQVLPEQKYFVGQGNTYWNAGMAKVGEEGGGLSRVGGEARTLSLGALEQLGMAVQYLYADPGVVIDQHGYTISADSPALACGFVPFELQAGRTGQ